MCPLCKYYFKLFERQFSALLLTHLTNWLSFIKATLGLSKSDYFRLKILMYAVRQFTPSKAAHQRHPQHV